MVETLEIWHPVNGQWLHFVQKTDTVKSSREFYTDGHLISTNALTESGHVKDHEIGTE
jgi:hypothetical protein